MKKRLVKYLLIFLLIVLPVLYFCFTMLLFSPFEGEHRPFHDAVPKDVDFYAAKLDLASDFGSFPEPKLFKALSASREWALFVASEAYQPVRELLGGRSFPEFFGQIRAELEQLPIDAMKDVVGRELAVAGRRRDDNSLAWAAFARITFKIKLAYEAFGYGIVRALASTPVQEFESRGDWVRMKLTGFGEPAGASAAGQEFFLLRDLDMLVLSNDEELIKDISHCSEQVSESLGFTGTFNDGVIKKREPEEERIEFSAAGPGLLNLLGYTPPVFDPTAMGPKVLLSLFDPRFIQSLAGSLDLGTARTITLQAAGAFDRDAVNRAETGIHMDSQMSLEEAWQVIANNFPEDCMVDTELKRGAFLVGALRCNLRDLLLLCERSLDPDLRTLIGDSLRDSKRYAGKTLEISGTVDFVNQMDSMLGDKVYFALAEPQVYNVPDRNAPSDLSKDTQQYLPWPRVALLFELESPVLFEKFLAWVTQIQPAFEGADRMDIDRVYKMHLPAGDEWVEVEVPQLGIERLCFGHFQDVNRSYFLFTTSSELYQQIAWWRRRARTSGESSARLRVASELVTKEMASLIAVVDMKGLRRVLDGLAVEQAKEQTYPDWPKIRQQVEDAVRSEFGSRLNEPQVEAEIDGRMGARERQWLTEVVPAAAERIRRGHDWLELFEATAVRLRLQRNWLSIAAQIDTTVRPAE
ncbi:MAG: hypothetical protein AB1486_11935 [Planctomycetota bacterium]